MTEHRIIQGDVLDGLRTLPDACVQCTVTVVARELNRSSVGCELNPEYVKIIRKRLNADSQLDTGVVSYRFEKVPS